MAWTLAGNIKGPQGDSGSGGGGGRQIIVATSPITSASVPAEPGKEYFLVMSPSNIKTTNILRFDADWNYDQLNSDGCYLVDESGRRWGGNAQRQTSDFKFGQASAYFGGSNSLFPTGDDTCGWGYGDFTVELWVKFQQFDEWSAAVIFDLANGRQLYVNPNGSGINYGWMISSSVQLSSSVWYHIALTRTAGTTRLFLDGTELGYADETNQDYGGVWESPRFGSVHAAAWNKYAGNGMFGWIDEIRIAKESKYSANFTPPAATYTESFCSSITLPSPVGNESLYVLMPSISSSNYSSVIVFSDPVSDLTQSAESVIKNSNTLTTTGYVSGNGWDNNWQGQTPVAKLIDGGNEWRLFSDGARWLTYYKSGGSGF